MTFAEDSAGLSMLVQTRLAAQRPASPPQLPPSAPRSFCVESRCARPGGWCSDDGSAQVCLMSPGRPFTSGYTGLQPSRPGMAMPAVPGNAGSGFAFPRVPPRRLRDGPKYAAQSRVAHVGCRQRNREAAAKGKAAGASAGAVPPSQNMKNQVFSVAPDSMGKPSKPFSRRPYAMPGSRWF